MGENIQQIEVQQTNTKTVYQSQFLFLVLAVPVTVIVTICVAIVFLEWWQLGRDVSISPIEITKAFVAPSLAVATDLNASVEDSPAGS